MTTLTSVKYLAESIGVSRPHVYRLLNAGHIPKDVAFRVKGRWKVHPANLEEWLRNGCELDSKEGGER